MGGQVHEFEQPTRFVAGTVGEPGERTFYLQATDVARTVSVALEKTQVSLLAERLVELLDEAHRRLGVDVGEETVDEIDNEPLTAPIEEEFRVGTLSLAWDAGTSMVVVEAVAVQPDEEEDLAEAELDVLRVRLTAVETRAFVARAQRVVAAGRPPCPLCGLPLETAGHICPRQNGYRR